MLNPSYGYIFVASWIALRSLSSGAHTGDPLTRNDGLTELFEI
jgi:hypothetical protein